MRPILAVVTIALAFVAGWPTQAVAVTDSEMASAVAKTYVTRALKSPATAEFDLASVHLQPQWDRVWAVVGNVDSQNSFGALIRSPYIAAVQKLCSDVWNPDCWRLVKLVIGDRTLVNLDLDRGQSTQSPAVQPGPVASAALVQKIQEKLQALGYDPGPADGVVGPRTRRAIGEFERDRGRPAKFRATEDLLDELKSAR